MSSNASRQLSSSDYFTSLSQKTISTEISSGTDVFAIDMDNDGNVDVLSTSYFDNKLAWYKNDGFEGFTQYVIDSSLYEANGIIATDLDGDGDMDVLAAQGQSPGAVYWYENTGNQVFTRHTIMSGSASGNLFVVDIDGDGNLDVVANKGSAGKIAWYENDGSQGFTEHTISTTVSNSYIVFAVDVDGDGDIDVLHSSTSDNTISWFENDGTQSPSFAVHLITTCQTWPFDFSVIDFDGDGDADVVALSSSDSSSLAWYENDGSGSFSEHEFGEVNGRVRGMQAIDVDNDGDIDVIISESQGDKLTFFENIGPTSNPDFTAHDISSTSVGNRRIFAIDLDNDNDVDIISAPWNDDNVLWYENFQPPQPSSQPSAQPSTQPSALPSSLPSAQPSAQPSTQPSALPSAQPSAQPSMQPSTQPSAQPSVEPSTQPSALPSAQPSAQPTSRPTATFAPTPSPTEFPTSTGQKTSDAITFKATQQLAGISASQFISNLDNERVFIRAIAQMLGVQDNDVTNVQVGDTRRRRRSLMGSSTPAGVALWKRRLETSGVTITYDVVIEVAAGESSTEVYETAVAVIVEGTSDSCVASCLATIISEVAAAQGISSSEIASASVSPSSSSDVGSMMGITIRAPTTAPTTKSLSLENGALTISTYIGIVVGALALLGVSIGVWMMKGAGRGTKVSAVTPIEGSSHVSNIVLGRNNKVTAEPADNNTLASASLTAVSIPETAAAPSSS
jgi:hypothetical protein